MRWLLTSGTIYAYVCVAVCLRQVRGGCGIEEAHGAARACEGCRTRGGRGVDLLTLCRHERRHGCVLHERHQVRCALHAWGCRTLVPWSHLRVCVCVWSGSREVGPPRGEKTRVCGTDKPRLFHPHISRAARHLQRPAGHVEALTQYQMNERAARLRQAEADKEKLPSECTFAPRINSNSKKLARLHRVKEEAKVRARACGAAGWPCPRHAHAQLTVGCLRFEMGGLCPSVPKMVRRPQLRRRRHSHGTRAIRRWASPRMSGCTRRRSSCRPRG